MEVKPVLPSSASLKFPFARVCVLLFCLFCSPNLCLALGEGAINLALAQSRSQDVRINGPLGASTAMRMDTGFPMQGGQGKSPLASSWCFSHSQIYCWANETPLVTAALVCRILVVI